MKERDMERASKRDKETKREEREKYREKESDLQFHTR